MTSEGDLIAVAQAMTASMDGLAEQVGTLNSRVEAQGTYGRRNRRMIWGIVVSLLVDAVFTIPIAWAVIHASSADDKASRNRQTLVTTCVASNESRADVRELWGKLFKLSPSAPQTDEQKKRLADFRGYIDKTYAPRDCSKI